MIRRVEKTGEAEAFKVCVPALRARVRAAGGLRPLPLCPRGCHRAPMGPAAGSLQQIWGLLPHAPVCCRSTQW